MSEKSKKRIALLVLLVVVLTVFSTASMAQQPDGGQLDSVVCGDDITCSSNSAAVKIKNTGAGAAFYGKATAPGTGVKGQGKIGVWGFSYNGQGVWAESNNGTGLYVKSNTGYGAQITSHDVGLQVYSTTKDGIYLSAGAHGIEVANAGWAGVWVDNAGFDGFEVSTAGRHGFHADSTTEHGLKVDNAGLDGVNIVDAGSDAMEMGDGTEFPSYGVYTQNPGTSGNALWVRTSDASGEWALWTEDKIHASNVTVGSVSLVAVVGGSAPLEVGDLVAPAGVADPMPNSAQRLMQVRVADGSRGDLSVGLVTSRMVLEPDPGKAAEGITDLVLHSAPGPAQPGDYVTITTSGVAQAKADANQGPILVGDRLALSSTPGHAAQAQVLTVDGVSFYAPGATIGAALTALDGGSGLIWVFVDPQ